jgi:hypothetical protein
VKYEKTRLKQSLDFSHGEELSNREEEDAKDKHNSIDA